MIIRKGDIIELWVEKMAYGGEGLARLDGFVIFIKGAIPGDRVIAKIIKKRRDYANALLIEIIDPSIDRIKPPCSYSDYCGGCQIQHLKYEKQLKYKRTYIQDSLMHIGSLRKIPVHEVIPSDNLFGYRNKMEFSFSDRRWLLPEEYSTDKETVNHFGLGLHMPGTFYKVLDIDACLLQHETGNLILSEVKNFVKQYDIPAYSLKEHTGFWRFLVMRYSANSNEWMVNLVTSEEKSEVTSALAKALCERFSDIRTVVNNISKKKAAVALGEKEIILTGKGYIHDTIGPFQFRISSNSFFQTNSSGAKKLYDKVVEYAELTGSEVVLDLYCGTGTIPVFLSVGAKEVIGMEISESAVIDANANCDLNHVNNCRFILGDIRKRLPDLRQMPDVLIVDPPRNGIHKDILSQVMNMAVKKIVYVSCNPATMARDMVSLSKKYDIMEVQPVDMFPHTYHIEAVAKLLLRKDV